MGEKLREDVWKTIAPVLHGIQRTSSEIILLELDSLRNFQEACLSHLKPSLCGFRKSKRFEQAARKLLNLPPPSYWGGSPPPPMVICELARPGAGAGGARRARDEQS